MKYATLREEVCRRNRDIVAAGLVVLTWGNVSGADREAGVMAIKPSGVDYDCLRPEDMVVLSLESGEVVDGELNPSSDTPTHLFLYQRFVSIGGIVHTHSACATSWSQAAVPLPCFGTTHADHFYGPVPVARALRTEEIENAYEHHTGLAIVDTFQEHGLDPAQVPAVLVPGHAPFTWGPTPGKAVENSIALEASARMALHTLALRPDTPPLSEALLDKHFLRKHGPGATYGQGR